MTTAHGAAPSVHLGSPEHCRRLGSRLYTVGHSNHDAETFLALLRSVGVDLVADVRSAPFSQQYPQFNQSVLRRLLDEGGIGYSFFGDELGGRPSDPGLYDEEGRVDYQQIRRTPAFSAGIDTLCRKLEESVVTLMCSEEDPLDCHRSLLISAALAERGIRPAHLRGDGRLESSDQLDERLLAETKTGAGLLRGLFAAELTAEDRRQLLEDAYRIQARRKGYRLPKS